MMLDKAFIDLLRQLMPRSIWEKMTNRARQAYIHEHWENGIKQQAAFSGKWVQDKWVLQLPWGGTRDDRFHPPEIKITQ